MTDRLCDVFLRQRGALLGAHGFTPDPTPAEHSAAGGVVFYHYTRPEHLDVIMATGGLYARLPVVNAEHIPELAGCYQVEGLLEPWPAWMADSQYFGDLCGRMMQKYVGDLLLRITLPPGFPGVYVAEMAHGLEAKYVTETGHPALNVGYDCRTGQEVCRAGANSYVAVENYRGGHVMPGVKATRRGEGLVIPAACLAVSAVQPQRSD
jgi:hypothetical protein